MGGDGQPSGVPRHIIHLAKALRKYAQVTVISGIDQGGYKDLKGLEVKHIALKGLSNASFLTRPLARLQNILSALRKGSPDLVWFHARLPVLGFRILYALRLWKPQYSVMFTLHGLPFGPGHLPVLHWFFARIEAWLARIGPMQTIVILDQRSKKQLACNPSPHEFYVLPNCSNLAPLPPKTIPETKHLVMTGRTGWQKDYAFAARLFSHLPAEYRLTLCGPGTERAIFQRRIALCIPPSAFERITFLGPITDVRKLLQTADAYLLTSRYEGLPIGAIEAFEAGLPIILRSFIGAADMVARHPCGLLIGTAGHITDAKTITQLLSRFERDEDLFRNRTKAVWQKTWSPQVFEENVKTLMAKVLQDPALVSPDFAHDDPAPHLNHSKNAVSPLPKLPPLYTDVSPSAENG